MLCKFLGSDDGVLFFMGIEIFDGFRCNFSREFVTNQSPSYSFVQSD